MMGLRGFGPLERPRAGAAPACRQQPRPPPPRAAAPPRRPRCRAAGTGAADAGQQLDGAAGERAPQQVLQQQLPCVQVQEHPQHLLEQQQEQQHVQHHEQQQQQQQQQQRQMHQHHQRQQYARAPPRQAHPAAVVATTWGLAERRAQLASLVRAADSVDGLAAVWLGCRAAAGPAELTVLFNRLAAVCEPRSMSVKGWNNAKALLRELLIASEDKMGAMGGPEFVYIVAALARLRAAPDQAWVNRWLAVSRHRLAVLQPAQLVVCLRALCRLDMPPGGVRACIAFPAWAHNLLAAVRPRLASLGAYDLVKLARGLADLGYKPARPFLAELAASAQPKLSSLDSVHLASLMGALSALKYEPDAAFMRAFYAEVYAKLPLFDDQDLATALTAFCSMRRLVRGDFLDEFLQEVGGKLPTFGTPALAAVLGALAQLGHKPSAEWTDKVAAHLESRVWKGNVHVTASAAAGLAACGLRPSGAFVVSFLAATLPKLGRMEAADAVALSGALARWGWRPEQGSRAQRLWLRWFERFCYALDRRALHPRQAVAVLESLAACGVSPEPATADHLVLQLVQGGLQHAPVGGVPRLLEVLAAAQHSPGPLFVKSYAACIRLVSTSLSAPQLALAMRCLADAGYAPASWWLVQMLAVTHARVTEFGAADAAALLGAAARLSQRSRLPSEKWSGDFAARFWSGLDGLGAQQLGEGLAGALGAGHSPSPGEWEAWERAASAAGWAMPLRQARDAVAAYGRARRPAPAPLLERLRAEAAAAQAAQAAEVAAAEAAREAAAAQLAAQRERLAQTMDAIAAAAEQQQQQQHQQQQQQHPAGVAGDGKRWRGEGLVALQGLGGSRGGGSTGKQRRGGRGKAARAPAEGPATLEAAAAAAVAG